MTTPTLTREPSASTFCQSSLRVTSQRTSAGSAILSATSRMLDFVLVLDGDAVCTRQSVGKAESQQGPDRDEPVARADLLALGDGARTVLGGHLANDITGANELGR